jgi:cell division protein FtsN
MSPIPHLVTPSPSEIEEDLVWLVPDIQKGKKLPPLLAGSKIEIRIVLATDRQEVLDEHAWNSASARHLGDGKPKHRKKKVDLTGARHVMAKPIRALVAKAQSADARFVVQVGAFSDAALARDARARVEKLGLSSYTQVVETAAGPRTRVRVGPFSDRGEADRTAAQIKQSGLPAAVLSL